MSAILGLLAAIWALIAVARRRRRALPARAVIVSPRRSTVIAADGAVRSVHSAELMIAPADVQRLWSPTNLENLGRTYWRFLSRVTLGLMRISYGHDERCVVFLGVPLRVLRFDAPEYLLESDHGRILWRIRDGLLVARAGRGCGFLSLDVRRHGEGSGGEGRTKLHIEVEVANFYPAIAAGFSMPVYEATQSAIHGLVTHAFLRSLATLDLAESKVGRLALPEPVAEESPRA